VSFTSNITLAGSTSPELDAGSQKAVVQATAESMQVDVRTVQYVGAVVVSSVVQLASLGDRRGSLRLHTTPERVADTAGVAASAVTTYTLMAQTLATVPLDASGYATTSALYTNLAARLSDAVTSGSFDTALHAHAADQGSAQLADAQATSAASSPPTVVTVEPQSDGSGSGDSGGLSTYTVAGVVLVLVLSLAMVVGCLYWRCVWVKSYRAKGSSGARTINVAEGNLVHKKPSFRKRLLRKLSSRSKAGFSAVDGSGAEEGNIEFQTNPVASAAQRYQQKKQQTATFYEDAVWDMDDDEGGEEGGSGEGSSYRDDRSGGGAGYASGGSGKQVGPGSFHDVHL
jgi:anti-anti-sigma regulatory factor